MQSRRGRSSSRRATPTRRGSRSSGRCDSARSRFEAAERRATASARVIARHAVALELQELDEFERKLMATEACIADAIAAITDPRDFRRLRLAD